MVDYARAELIGYTATDLGILDGEVAEGTFAATNRPEGGAMIEVWIPYPE